jgi:hypothetical protein
VSDGALMSEHRERELRRTAAGGFALEVAGTGTIRLQPEPGGWRVAGKGELDGWFLHRGSLSSVGFILMEADGTTEAGRTMSLPGTGRDADLRYLFTSDGRLYRMRLYGPRDGRYELQGWEVPGAYLTARPGSRNWKISPDPASSGLREIRPLLILFAAEILDSEEPLAEG